MRTADGPTAEARALEQVSERLRSDFGLTADEVDAAIAEALAAYAGRPVRDFVPILVERQVRERLGRRQTSPAGRHQSS
ncbi:three-helix bundle dimerization domain-containing protein [Nocardioides sp. T2.26MG-1]|uniref:three-helix bundle dimerization domain-containing protein n=1 Tax=Nocardioides sp. T2.26MG-1 TaxID=3041166 RepID=UPI0024775311|nr:hypothetical protein [Nocardioides sp. T2.26MG-1]CAI9400729.1 hypothetical protein HIDPHFAB_00462 [Nocardioides sp. T2.26MG-1]